MVSSNNLTSYAALTTYSSHSNNIRYILLIDDAIILVRNMLQCHVFHYKCLFHQCTNGNRIQLKYHCLLSVAVLLCSFELLRFAHYCCYQTLVGQFLLKSSPTSLVKCH
jgi:hypothetical protein